MSGVHRKRNVCAECSRRKIACSKTLPCDQCTKKGIGETCSVTVEHDRRLSSASSASSQPACHPLSPRSRHLSDHPHADGLSSINETSLQPTGHVGRRSSSFAEATKQKEHVASTSPAVSSSTGETHDPELEDAATILEFLAWGRSKKPAHEEIPTSEADVVWHDDVEPQADTLALRYNDSGTYDSVSPLLAIQMLLPNQQQVFRLLDYHLEYLLWYHNSIHASTFRRQVHDFYEQHNGIIHDNDVNLQWVALLFSVLLGSMSSAPPSVLEEFGYRIAEQSILSRKWIRAVITCLNLADYTGRHSIYSVQAIAVLTMSAHLLGYSNQQSVLLASANRIAQSLGLHRLASNHSKTTIEQETGRRVWAQLCQQDWFSIPFSECYSINRQCTTSPQPRNCDDETMELLSESQPTITTYSRWLYSIASLMPQLQDELTCSNTAFTAYEHVLHYDKKMRTLATSQRPAFLASGPIDASWPCYTRWARQAAAMSSSHKIIMIHRKFLVSSFANPFFKFTRATCIAASKTILKVYREVVNDNGPTLWIHHAFTVAACVTLCLDIRHRSRDDSDSAELQSLVQEAIDHLRASPKSAIATRGSRLLATLLGEDHEPTAQNNGNTKKRKAGDFVRSAPCAKHQKSFDMTSFMRKLRQQDIATQQNISPGSRLSGIEIADSDVLVSSLPPKQSHSDRLPDDFAYDRSHSRNLTVVNDGYDHRGQSLIGSVNSFEDLLFLASNYDFT